MSDDPSRLEFLPNEILLDTFHYFDTGDLYRAFYNLNYRFNALIRSIDKPCLTLHEITDHKIFSSYIYTLKLGDEVNINPSDFVNIRCLQLLMPSKEQLKQFEPGDVYPHLEHLSINCENIDFTRISYVLWSKILWNQFPYLKSCELYNATSIFTAPMLPPSYNLLSLKIGVIDIVTYKSILSIYQNLRVFQFTICTSPKEPVDKLHHSNLKRMIIQFGRSVSPGDDCKIDDYLSFVPNLKELIVNRMVYNVFLERYFDYKWFGLHIAHHLSSLQKLKFNLSIVHLEKSFTSIDKSILDCVQKRFKQVHNHQ